MIRRFFFATVALLVSISMVSPVGAVNPPLPAWANDAVIYEVNIRQFTPEGTFDAFRSHLPRLEEMGVDILWLMPIHPISQEKRKGSLGSPYAVADYKGINPLYGSAQDFQELVDEAHSRGMKVILDWVANHTGWDNPWIANKAWYTQNGQGQIIHPAGTDWTDVADLNFSNAEMRAAMIDALKYWVTEFDIDGYRADVAGSVPVSFWNQARTELDAIKPVFMLAEDGSALELLNSAFGINYGWDMLGEIRRVAGGTSFSYHIHDLVASKAKKFPTRTYSMNFITNHDENSWNGTEYEFLGAGVDAMTVLYFTIPGMPLVYNGQEIRLRKRLQFFEKDAIDWANGTPLPLIGQLSQLKEDNSALDVGQTPGTYKQMKTDSDEVIAFTRTNGQDRVTVLINASPRSRVVKLTVGADHPAVLRDYLTDSKVRIRPTTNLTMPAWSYRLWVTGESLGTTISPTSVSVKQSSLTLKRGAKAVIKPQFAPVTTTDTYLTWTSSSPAIARVSGGVVTARKPGRAVITAKHASGKKVVLNITVK
jgi:glycosidase